MANNAMDRGKSMTTRFIMRHQAELIALFIASSAFFAIQLAIDAKAFTGDAGAYWALSSAITEGTFPKTIRGYSYPLLLTPFRFAFDHSEQAGLLLLKLGQSIGYGYLFSILFPNLYQVIFDAKPSAFTRLIPALLMAFAFPGLISYPLSDAPSLGIMALALYACIKAIKSQSFSLLIVAGLLAYLAYNTRTIYLFSFFTLMVIAAIFFSKSLKQRFFASTCFLLGALVGAAPQMAINYSHHSTRTPLVVTDVRGAPLFARQLAWGMIVDKYETHIDPQTKKAIPVFYANNNGALILQQNGGFENNQSVVKIAGLMTQHPITFINIYLRHIALALDVRDGEVYTRNPTSEKNIQSLILLSIVLFGLTQLGRAIFFQASSEPVNRRLLYTLVLLAPCIAIIPGAIETRFFLPIHCLSYCALAFGGIKKEAIAMQLACTAILTAAIFTFAAKSADSPIHSRPESYIPTPSNI
ncbi:hypothetical protein EIQ06_12070 [Xanthomonas campestris pv. campestris]|uniref:Membrane protein n=2 Tax=Xanthomonas campestris TaxID=339 RepID=B0RR94_XANCB|nr:hypothetical protein [Xanthomonas campestris]MDO0841060.1 glycosyltransferase family 39 protein [Xanthomonas campestris pv. campestris]MEA0621803.1 hypothetical protein [Xanthomonas campestris pv. campestris]MEA0625875.1 hypothetical protein [Xanthomonas campestris pv. campestris]MEA0646692.1 hypothetical protein [Xanthomonas campestris pv. campestris]MEA0666651.1 hypothetical protein [Xanthomonas campestris pv. campestris]